jgi:hypothetical protein
VRRPSGETADGAVRTRSGPFPVDLTACPDGGIRGNGGNGGNGGNATEPHMGVALLERVPGSWGGWCSWCAWSAFRFRGRGP